jgi:hypothetical protein
MGGKKPAGENSKKAAGQARKAETASKKAAEENNKLAAKEDDVWATGSKSSNAKREAAEAKKLEAAQKKAERDAQLAEEEASLKKVVKEGKKTAVKKTRGLDLAELDDKPVTLNASGIENALDALELAGDGKSSKIDRHPERRFKAAFAAYEARRAAEVEQDGSMKGLRQQQRKEAFRKEFEKSDENPFNQARVDYDATQEDVGEVRQKERAKIEQRLGGD